jgi:hypothetical protein
MSLDQAWTIEEMGRVMRAERMADAERYRMTAGLVGPKRSPRMALAKALRALASLVDGEITTVKAQPERPFGRAVRAA